MARSNHKRLLRIAKANKELFSNWKEGVSLERDTGKAVDELLKRAAVGRFKLALDHRRCGNKLLRGSSPAYRTAISRYYYSMYHCLRAAAFVFHGGDDHESHSALPQHVPNDFPSHAIWSNSLKDARAIRNAADYDPYPNGTATLRKQALQLRADATALVALTKCYLVAKGCAVVWDFNMSNAAGLEREIKKYFESKDVVLTRLEVRAYPDETIIIAWVNPNLFTEAVTVATKADRILTEKGIKGFVTVRKDEASRTKRPFAVRSLNSPRVTEFVTLLLARSRTNEIQPSLQYVPDAENSISIAKTSRHHLIFGRRGAGKTALLGETKRLIEADGCLSIWMNMQTYRQETTNRVYLYFLQKFSELVQAHIQSALKRSDSLLLSIAELQDRIGKCLSSVSDSPNDIRGLLPRAQHLIRRFLDTYGVRVFVFLDDFHYVNADAQAPLLDHIHGTIRDCDAWLKVATIQHLTKWFDRERQIGLEFGHDTSHIDLDVTLQNPARAKKFLEKVLLSYASYCGISALSRVMSPQGALDRLVLASGAVPRDYLSLCAGAVQEARTRPNAKLVGVQDVNKATADAKQKKIEELEDDAASLDHTNNGIVEALNCIRSFCIDIKGWTCFRVDLRDKEKKKVVYNLLQQLCDLRLIHLIEPSLSDERIAGRRSEVYMLDLSQYVDYRLRKKLKVLDFVEGHFVLKQTGTNRPEQRGDTPNKRLSLFRRAPVFALSELE